MKKTAVTAAVVAGLVLLAPACGEKLPTCTAVGTEFVEAAKAGADRAVLDAILEKECSE